eukprot:scaffold320284_cov30-Tisochrysis_lutea.AAC.1
MAMDEELQKVVSIRPRCSCTLGALNSAKWLNAHIIKSKLNLTTPTLLNKAGLTSCSSFANAGSWRCLRNAQRQGERVQAGEPR